MPTNQKELTKTVENVADQQGVQLTPELIASIVSAAVREANKPYEDPAVTAQKKADKERLRREIEEKQRLKVAAIEACPHKRDDETWNLHAQMHVDGSVGIICGQCFGVFEPGHPKYPELYSHIQWNRIAIARQVTA